MNLTAFKEALFARGARLGFADMEMYYRSNASFRCTVFKGEVDDYTVSGEGGLAFRGVLGGKVGYAYTEKIDESSIDLLLEGALAGAGVTDAEEETVLFAGSPAYGQANCFSEELEAVTPEQKIAFLKELEAECLRLDPRVAALAYNLFESNQSERMIANTRGLNRAERSNLALFWAELMLKDGNETKTAGRFKIGRNFAAFDAKAMAAELVAEAASYLGAEPVPSGAYPVLIRHDAAAQLLATFAGVFSADNAQKGKSKLQGKTGQRIAGENISIIDDPFLPDGASSHSFDAEGVACSRLAVVEHGTLATLLHNLKTAAKVGVPSTGHAARNSYKGAITVAPSNLYLQPGEKEFGQLVEEMGEGVVITDIQGMHSGANPISGDFSLGAFGYLVQGGKIRRPVNQITVAGNFYELLNSVRALGSDLQFTMGMGGWYIGAPSLLVESLSIGGK